MFPQQPQQQFRNTNANVQLFYRNSTWAKPPGVSQIYMMLIGGGGSPGGSGGGSGAVTTWWGSAQNVPDDLVVSVSAGGTGANTTVNYRGTNGLNALLTASAGTSTTGGTAMAANQFAASGFFQSVAGQDAAGTVTESSTTFLSAGSGTAGSTVTANYGYTSVNSPSYFQLQPIIVGVGSGSNAAVTAGIGCSANSGAASGGPGLVIIAAW